MRHERLKELEKEIDFDKSTIRLAMPETAKQAQECLDQLKSQMPEMEKALESILKKLPDEKGRPCLNSEWLRTKAEMNVENKQAQYVAAMLPVEMDRIGKLQYNKFTFHLLDQPTILYSYSHRASYLKCYHYNYCYDTNYYSTQFDDTEPREFN